MSEHDEAPMTFSQEEIGNAGQPWDLGHYSCKLLDVQVIEPRTPTGAPSLLAIFEVLSGPRKGDDLRIYRNLGVYKTKKGGWFTPGLQEIKADLLSAKGIDPSVRLSRDPQAARVLYANGLRRKELDIVVYEETYRDKVTGENKTARKKRVAAVLGGASTAPSLNGVVADPLAGMVG